MIREWYSYAPARRGISAPMLRDRLPASIKDRLLKGSDFDFGANVDAADVELIADLDRFFDIGRSKDVLRWLRSEADHRSLEEYQYSIVNPPDIDYRPRPGIDLKKARTLEDYAQGTKYRWPRVHLGIRELFATLNLPFDRLLIVSPATKALFETAGISGVRYAPLPDGLWLMQVLPRVPCHADHIVAPDYEAATQSVTGAYLFGWRYEQADFGSEDVQLIDRIVVRKEVYRYRTPWLVVSPRLVSLCWEHKVDRLESPGWLFRRGLVPILVGQGPITSTILT